MPFLYKSAFATEEYNNEETQELWMISDPPWRLWSLIRIWKSPYIIEYWMSVPNLWFDTTRFLCDEYGDSDQPGYRLMIDRLIETDNAPFVQRLLEKGIHPEPDDGPALTPLLTTADFPDPGLCKTLIKHGANIFARVRVQGERRGDYALMLAIYEQDIRIVTILAEAIVEQGGSVDTRGEYFQSWSTPLLQAVEYHYQAGHEMIQVLLDHGADMLAVPDYDDYSTSFPQNAFHRALYCKNDKGSMILTEHLEKMGLWEGLASVGFEGKIPLHLAIVGRMWQVARKLIELGSDLLLEADRGMNALHFAMKESATDILDLLLDKGPVTWADEKDRRVRGIFLHHVAARNVEGVLMLKKLKDLKKISIDFQHVIDNNPSVIHVRNNISSKKLSEQELQRMRKALISIGISLAQQHVATASIH